MIAKFEDIVRMREEIEKMNQSTIAEIRSFSDPPEFVRNVMAAVYTLLGEDRKDVKGQGCPICYILKTRFL